MSDPYARIFLLSHMRACTSLAGHILGSHPRINGYYEMHISYEDASALDRQFGEYRQHESVKANSHYLFDKLLHNNYRLVADNLGAVDIRLLVSLREPEQSIASMVDLFARKKTAGRYASPEEAAGYYIHRLEWIAGFCQSCSLPYSYYDAEVFFTDPDRLLGKLGEWLELDSPLSAYYQHFSQTGMARKGDSSELIHTGRIGRDRSDYSHIRIPGDALRRAQDAYRDCRHIMIDHARGTAVH
jgi:hypothetical protein